MFSFASLVVNSTQSARLTLGSTELTASRPQKIQLDLFTVNCKSVV
ncbi:MAG: hypothetical protein IKR40_10330 [Treponema sp.]|nr:hypothetical protein [Treponema sp.]